MFLYHELKREMDRLNNSIIDISKSTNPLLTPRLVQREIKENARQLKNKMIKFDSLLKEELINGCTESIIIKKAIERKKYTTSLDSKYFGYMKRCCASGKEFSISQEYFNKTMSEDCVYCGEEGGTIDRISSNIGYIESNCQPCCLMCNMMKTKYTHKDFINKVKRIYENINK